MKKMLLRQFVFSTCLITVLCFAGTHLSAQCKYNVITLNNDTTSFSVTCDFPVKANTGDSALDMNNFVSAFKIWNQSSSSSNGIVLPTLFTSGIKAVFFTIGSADFDLYSEEKKLAMKASPQLYQVSQL